MEQKTYAERKIRMAFSKAGSKAMEWRAVGSITIYAPGLPEPVVISDVAWLIVLHEARGPSELRHAEVRLLSALDRASEDVFLAAGRQYVLRRVGRIAQFVLAALLGFALHGPLVILVRHILGA